MFGAYGSASIVGLHFIIKYLQCRTEKKPTFSLSIYNHKFLSYEKKHATMECALSHTQTSNEVVITKSYNRIKFSDAERT